MTASWVDLSANDGRELEFLRLYRLMTRDQQLAVTGMLICMCQAAPAADAVARVGL
jgi:hypothetical protein